MKKLYYLTEIKTLNFTSYLSFTLLLFVCIISCSSESNKTESQEQTELPSQTFTASFKLSGDGYNEVITYNSNDNLIFCKLTGNDIWIRFARDKVANGENAPHIDIDICNYAGPGDYSPVDPQNRPCPAGLLWDIFWHDGDKVYSNQENSSPCQLTLTLNGDILSGVFNCSQVIRFNGSETIEITEGTFTCEIE